MSVTLDKPEQINMWVMLSRRHQVQLHMKGLKVKGIMSALRREFGDHGNRVANYVVPIEFAISEAGGEVDYKLVNVHVMQKMNDGVFYDRGVYNSMDEAGTFENRALFAQDKLEVVLTTDPVRPENGQYYQPA